MVSYMRIWHGSRGQCKGQCHQREAPVLSFCHPQLLHPALCGALGSTALPHPGPRITHRLQFSKCLNSQLSRRAAGNLFSFLFYLFLSISVVWGGMVVYTCIPVCVQVCARGCRRHRSMLLLPRPFLRCVCGGEGGIYLLFVCTCVCVRVCVSLCVHMYDMYICV